MSNPITIELGIPGIQGAPGVGVPAGGTTGQALVKASDDDFDTEWITLSGVGGSVAWADVTGKPTEFTPAAHVHVIADVTGLQSALDGKQAALVSGTSIKTVGGTSILGSGDIPFPSGGSVVSTDISDSTTAGRALLTAADEAAQRTALGLGTAALSDDADFATAAQGGLADSAVQPGDLATVATSGAYSDLTGIPSTFAPSAHTHPASAISDSTAAGRALLTAADAAAQRTALSVETTSQLNSRDTANRDRANHTGTQLAATISDFASAVAATAAVAANTAKVSNATHTGDVTGSTALTIAAGAVTLSKMANLANSTILGRATAGTGVPEALTATQVRTILNVANGATANSPDATLLARANHTGTQAASTISDFNAAADARITASDKVSSNTTGITGADQITNMVSLTQAEYDAIGSPSSSTLYVIV